MVWSNSFSIIFVSCWSMMFCQAMEQSKSEQEPIASTSQVPKLVVDSKVDSSIEVLQPITKINSQKLTEFLPAVNKTSGDYSAPVAHHSLDDHELKELTKGLMQKNFNKVSQFILRHPWCLNESISGEIVILGFACATNQLKVVKFALDHGADITLKDEHGRLPYNRAARRGNKECLEAVVEHAKNFCIPIPPLTIYESVALGDQGRLENFLDTGGDIQELEKVTSCSLLHAAVSGGRRSLVMFLLKKGAVVEAEDSCQITPLHVAAREADAEIVNILISNGARVDALDEDKWTPLHYCVFFSANTAVTKSLLDAGANKEAQTKLKLTPLHLAADRGHTEVVKLLIDAGANKEALAQEQLTPLHVAAYRGQTAVAKLLVQSGANKEARQKDQFTPLHEAARKGRTQVVKFLISKKVNKEAQTKFKQTPLHYAALEGHTEVVKLLIDAGANREAQTTNQFTPLHVAAQFGQTAVAKLLVQSGANKEARQKDQFTPLHEAARKGRTQVVKFLISKKVNKEAQTKFKQTPLHYAALEGHTEVVKLLIDAGANREAQTTNQFTPLHVAAQFGQTAVAKLLVQSGANKEARNKNQYTPLHLAAYRGQTAVVKLLIDARANINVKTIGQLTPLVVAVKQGNSIVVKFLIGAGAKTYESMSLKLFRVIKAFCSPLHVAASEGNVEAARLLLLSGVPVDHICVSDDRRAGFQLSTIMGGQYTPLHSAVIHGQSHTAELLLSAGANKEGMVNPSIYIRNLGFFDPLFWGGVSPMQVAAYLGHKDVVRVFIKKNPMFLFLKSTYLASAFLGSTSRWSARRGGHQELEKFIWDEEIRHGGVESLQELVSRRVSDLNQTDENDKTFLHWAAEGKHLAVSKLLIDNKIKLNVCDDKGNSALHYAASKGYLDIITLLLNNKALVNLQCKTVDIAQYSPLHYAAENGHWKAIELLISKGADITLLTKNKRTALQLAIAKGHRKFLHLVGGAKLKKGLVLEKGVSSDGTKSEPSSSTSSKEEILDVQLPTKLSELATYGSIGDDSAVGKIGLQKDQTLPDQSGYVTLLSTFEATTADEGYIMHRMM